LKKSGRAVAKVLRDPRQPDRYYSRMRKSLAICLLLSGLLATTALTVAPTLAAPAGNTKASWVVQNSPNPSGNGTFNGVECTSLRACVAVGSFFNPSVNAQLPLGAAWDGRAWSQQPIPAPAQTDTSDLNGVSCVMQTFCAAVGNDILTSKRSVTLAEVRRGNRWEITPTPPLTSVSFNALQSVSCSSPTDCMAVGNEDKQFLIEHWQGANWTIQSAPMPPGSTFTQLYGVSCVTSKWCMAAGYYGSASAGVLAFTEIWNGTQWSIRPAEQVPGKGSQFVGVSCTSKSSCTAVGTVGDLETVNDPLAERWNGKVWTVQPVPHPTRQINNSLTGVGCSTASACTAVGEYFATTGQVITFADSWNGKAWVLQPTVNPSTTNNDLIGVACTSATACTAVGGYAGPGSVSLSLIERYSVGR